MKNNSITTQKKNSLFTLASLLIFTLLTVLACTISDSGPKPSPSETDKGVEDSVPQVKSWEPGEGALLAIDGTIEIKFTEKMDLDSVELAFQLLDQYQEPVFGKFSWQNSYLLTFEPTQLLVPGQPYQWLISQRAVSEDGIALGKPFIGSFFTANRLPGMMVYPADGSNNIFPQTPIRVTFKRPIVPTSMLRQTEGLLECLQIEPYISGKGFWENPYTYLFKPDKPFASGVRYTVTLFAQTINQYLPDKPLLDNDVSWQFETLPPTVKEIRSVSDRKLNLTNQILPDDHFEIEFGQAMDTARMGKYVGVYDSAQEQWVNASFAWSDDQKTVTLYPYQPLKQGNRYMLVVLAEAPTADGGSIPEQESQTFSVLPLPGIHSVDPAEDESGTYRVDYTIEFKSAMDPESLAGKIVFEPAIVSPQPPYYDTSSDEITFYGLQPSIHYTITVLPGISDVYGNLTTTPYQFSFTNGDRPALANLELPANMPVLFRSGGPQEFFVQYTNVKSLTYSLYQLSPEDFLRLDTEYPKPQAVSEYSSQLIWKQGEDNLAPKNEVIQKRIAFSGQHSGSLPSGFYALQMTTIPEQPEKNVADWRLLAIVDSNLTLKLSAFQALAWITHLTNGAPIENVRVKLYEYPGSLVAEATTDAKGLASFQFTSRFNPTVPYYAVADQGRFAIAVSNWQSGNPELDNVMTSYFTASQDKPVVYLYTDRPVYRPGQPVYFKGILRLNNDLAYGIPGKNLFTQVEIEVENYQARLIERQVLPLSVYGTFNGVLELKEKMPPGNYLLSARLDGRLVERISFNVAEYRRQTFQVNVSSEKENYLAGQAIKVQVGARYLTGNAVQNATAKVEIGRTAYRFIPDNLAYQDYVFSDDAILENELNAYPRSQGQFDLTTDENGNASLQFPLPLINRSYIEQYSIDATVTDIAGNIVIDHSQVLMHPSTYLIGLKPQRKVFKPHEAQTASLVVLDWDENPVANQPIILEIRKENWFRVEREEFGTLKTDFSVRKDLVMTLPGFVTDPQGKIQVPFTLLEGGVYELRALVNDPQGNTTTAAVTVWVDAPDTYLVSRQWAFQSASIITDKNKYEVGETAELLINSPFQGVSYALVTVERGSILHQEVYRMEGNTLLAQIEIRKEMAPNAFFGVVVVKGMDEFNSRPAFASGLSQFQVNRSEQQLFLDIQPSSNPTTPGQELAFKVRTTDGNGNPVAAEFSMAVTDQAALINRESNTRPILDFFFNPRSLQVRTSIPMALLAEEINFHVQNNLPVGESMGSGMKGDGIVGVMEIREKFPDTAFWRADLETNDRGEADVLVKLPDNPTTWQVDVRGVSLNTQVGQKSINLVSNKPLLLIPQTPAFFIEGDQLAIGVLVQNTTDQLLKGVVQLENMQGLTMLTEEDPEREFEIQPEGSQLFRWEVQVNQGVERVDLLFAAKAGEFSDRTVPLNGSLDRGGIPAYRYAVLGTLNHSGVITKPEQVRYEISSAQAPQTKLVVEVAPSLISSMQASLDFNLNSPVGGVEQVASRVLPVVNMMQYLKVMKLENEYLPPSLIQQVNFDLRELYVAQNGDGGWGWLFGQPSQGLPTAYVVLTLLRAKELGSDYFYRQVQLDAALDYLENQVIPINELLAVTHIVQQSNRQAFILYVLAENGRVRASDLGQLFENREHMNLYARALLAVAIHKAVPTDSRLMTLQKEFESTAIRDESGAHWHEPILDDWNWNTDVRTTSLVLSMLAHIKPDHVLIDEAMKWIITNRIQGHWTTTQENAWATTALTDWAILRNEPQSSYMYAIQLNSNQLTSRQVSPANMDKVEWLNIGSSDLVAGQSNQLLIQRDQGPGSMFYTVYQEVTQPVEHVQVIDQGISIQREYLSVNDLSSPIEQVRVGDVILVKLKIMVPDDLRYVMIQDPIPAGMEATLWEQNEAHAEKLRTMEWQNIFELTGSGRRFFPLAELNPNRVVLFADKLTASYYEYSYLLRAYIPGLFHVLPPTAQQMYNPQVFGQGEGGLIKVVP